MYVCVLIFYHIRIQTVHLILLSTSTLGAPDTETSCRADHSRPPWRRTPAGRSLAETPLLWMLVCVGTGSRTESEGAFVRGTGKNHCFHNSSWMDHLFLPGSTPHWNEPALWPHHISSTQLKKQEQRQPPGSPPPRTPEQSLHAPSIAAVLTQ